MKTKSKKSIVTGSETQFDTKNTLHHLFEENLKDIYHAEQQLIYAIPEFIDGAENDDLKDILENHLLQTRNQAQRIEKIFTRLNIENVSKTCEAMEGLIEEAKSVISDFEEGPVLDSALIIAVQKIEHYEIATYGSLCELADVLGLQKTKEILGWSLEEEKETDETLTDMAQDINDEACEISERELAY